MGYITHIVLTQINNYICRQVLGPNSGHSVAIYYWFIIGPKSPQYGPMINQPEIVWFPKGGNTVVFITTKIFVISTN